MIKWLLLIPILISLVWDAPPSDEVGYKVYAKASSDLAYRNLTTCTATNINVKVDGRKNWYFYVTAFNKFAESVPSNTIYVPRGY